MNVPIKLSDFFGKLSISHSPFSWVVWFAYFSALIIVDTEIVRDVYFIAVAIVLIYCAVKSALDKEAVDYAEFRAERRFIAGSGLAALLVGSAVALSDAKYGVTLRYIAVPGLLMGIVYMVVGVRIPHRSGEIHNFTQTYLATMASYSGFVTLFVQAEDCGEVGCVYKTAEELWAYLFFISWLVFFSIFLVRLVAVSRGKSADSDGVGT